MVINLGDTYNRYTSEHVIEISKIDIKVPLELKKLISNFLLEQIDETELGIYSLYEFKQFRGKNEFGKANIYPKFKYGYSLTFSSNLAII